MTTATSPRKRGQPSQAKSPEATAQEASKPQAKKPQATKAEANEPIEKQLWKTADKLRKNIDAAEYKHIVVGLVGAATGCLPALRAFPPASSRGMQDLIRTSSIVLC